MDKNDEIKNLNIESNEEIEIEYNEDFENEKTKSLNKFPTKLNNNNEFYLENSYKNFSKSLNMNFRQCFAPKSKSKKSSKNPTPITLKKKQKINNLDTEDKIITEEVLSEKESSLNNESSLSSDYEVNNQNDNLNNNNVNDKKYTENKNENKIIINSENQNNLNEICKNKKLYEHKTINIFNYNQNDGKESIKSIRNKLYKRKINALKKIYKEVEYEIKNKDKKDYRLDLIPNKKRNELDNEYKIIHIKNVEENESSEEEYNNEDMDKFRATITYHKSKLNKENKNQNDDKGFTIYKVLLNNKKY